MKIQSIAPLDPSDAAAKSTLKPAEKGAKPFLETLKDSLSQVNSLQKEADHSVADLVAGKDQEIHQTMIAVEKADISFQLMMQVRNKILSAYEEISRMQV